MPHTRLILGEPLLQEAATRPGGRILSLVSLLIGLGFASFLNSMPCTRGQGEQPEPAVTMAREYMQPEMVQRFKQLPIAQQPAQLVRPREAMQPAKTMQDMELVHASANRAVRSAESPRANEQLVVSKRQTTAAHTRRALVAGIATAPMTWKALSESVAHADGGMRVAIAGATGLIGKRLVKRLVAQGGQVSVLTRDVAKAKKVFPQDGIVLVEPAKWKSVIENGVDAVVNLAGEPIATRWSGDVKREIVRSRIEPTKLLVEAINACPAEKKPKVFVSGSAIGFYGTDLIKEFDEGSAAGSDYLAKLCVQWEAEANRAEGTRVVNLRTGLVLDKEGGVMGKTLPVFLTGGGGPLGSGKQWFSWIHHEDEVGLIEFAIANKDVEGPLDATGPEPVTMQGFSDALGKAVNRPALVPVPEFALQTLLGEGAVLVTEGQKVVPKKALSLGYKFKFSTIDAALREIVA